MPDRNSGVEKRQSQGLDGVRQYSFQSGSGFDGGVKQNRKPTESINNRASSKAIGPRRENRAGLGLRLALPRN
jgi:hypothetical protein